MQLPVNSTVCGRSGLVAAALIVALAAAVGARQAAPVPAPGESTLIIFVNGREVGREQAALARTPVGWTITSTGALGAPVNLFTKRFEITYTPDWQPVEMKVDATLDSKPVGLATSFATTTAINEITQGDKTGTKTDPISARAVVIPNNAYAAYEALAVRLLPLTPGAELPVYVAPQMEIKLTVRAVTPATYQTPAGPVATKRFSVTLQHPGAPMAAEITVDERGRFAKLEIPSGGLSVARVDIAGVASRQQTFRNPTDSDVKIPASGFGLAGTLTTPAVQGRLRHPAVLLVAGAGPIDRDATVAGIPLFAQMAGQLAERDFVVLRYDRRGSGQSGGRLERVTLQDYADDAVAAVRWLARRKDVDSEQLFIAGHAEGATVAMLAAAAEKKVDGVVLLAGMSLPGREVVLEQQKHLLASSKLSEDERNAKIDLQKQILDAAITEKGWEALPAEVRAAADTPLFRSVLTFDPAQAMTRFRQPVLILQGDLDTQVRPHHADRLAELSRARKKSGATELKHISGLNHLFVPAKTGEIAEYPSLTGKTVSPDVASAIAAWVASVPR